MDDPNGHSPFPATRWTVVLQARGSGGETTTFQALEKLCEDYWYPLYAYARRRGYGAADAQDLTQGFFEYALSHKLFASAERNLGKLRTFLLTAFERHLGDEVMRARSEKRGGKNEFVPLHDCEAKYAIEPVDSATPVTVFERTWAYTVLEVTTRRLAQDEAASGRGAAFPILEPFLTGDGASDMDYNTAAARLGCSVDSVRHFVKRLRRRFREALRRQIADTLQDPSPQQIDEELAALRTALST